MCKYKLINKDLQRVLQTLERRGCNIKSKKDTVVGVQNSICHGLYFHTPIIVTSDARLLLQVISLSADCWGVTLPDGLDCALPVIGVLDRPDESGYEAITAHELLAKLDTV